MSELAANNPHERDAKPTTAPAQAREARRESVSKAQKENREAVVAQKRNSVAAAPVDWEALRKDIEAVVKDKGCHPIFVRLSWHDAGTYCDKSKTGGAHACMRFSESGESTHGANAGLDIAREILKPIKEKYENVSNADLWAFSACVAIKAAGGPEVEFRFGRSDAKDCLESAPEGRLPDGDKGAPHLRDVFHRMGLNDQEIVALSGAHTLGGCHKDRSGFEGNWTAEPLKFDNSFFTDIMEKKWDATTVEGTGCPQFKDDKGLMMLSTDLALKEDDKFLVHAKAYAENQQKFFDDFAKAFQKLQELGYSDLHALK